MREIIHLQAGQCGNQIGSKVCIDFYIYYIFMYLFLFHALTKKPDDIYFSDCVFFK